MLFRAIIKTFAFVVFCLLSGYVALYGKKGSGIHVDYVITAVILLGVMWFG